MSIFFRITKISFFVCCAFGALACTKEIDAPSGQGETPVSFQVGPLLYDADTADTKVSVSQNAGSYSVSWNAGDQVSMFVYRHGTGVVNFSDRKFTASSGGATTTFSGYVPNDFSPLPQGYHPIYMIHPAAPVTVDKYVEASGNNEPYYLMSGLSIPEVQDGTGWKYCWFFSNNGMMAAGSKNIATPENPAGMGYTLPKFVMGNCLLKLRTESQKLIRKIEVSYTHASGPGLVGPFKFYTKWKEIMEGCLVNTITIEREGGVLPQEIYIACRGPRAANGNQITFTFTATDGSVLVRTLKPSVNYAAGKVYNLGAIPLDEWNEGVVESATEAVKNMGIGVNICNSFENGGGVRGEPLSWETTNARDRITPVTMTSIAAAGFKCVRIPVTWVNYMDDPMSEIDADMLDRIEEVVNYALDAGLYCIINMHHDTGNQKMSWLYADWERYEELGAGFRNIWLQVANRFNKYGHKLLFESFNEIVDKNGTWFYSQDPSGYYAVNALNQDFVALIRQTGGNNETRNLIVTTYCASTYEHAFNGFFMPLDGVVDHLIVQVHSYLPLDFVTSRTDGRSVYYDTDVKEIDDMFALLKKYILDKGYPCVIGEYGAFHKKLEDGTQNDVHRGHHAGDYIRRSLKHGVCPIYWYNPMDYRERDTGGWTFPVLKDSLITAYQKYMSQTAMQ